MQRSAVFRALFFVLVLAWITLLPHSLSAHEYISNNGIGAVLHIEPDDDPIIGQSATLLYEFSSRNKNFDVRECTCVLTIATAATSSTLLLDPVSVYLGRVDTIFPKRDSYTLTLSGTPKVAGAFNSFTLTDQLPVARAPGERAKLSHHFYHLVVAGASILVGLYSLATYYMRGRQASEKSVVV